ncbi:iron chelate uptake ABC transporter family permease subunit [Pseudarthrobacter sp. J75]|uniref:iron chelate uptake ABC transporter family permease subunit n=1 Tax=unclassified Pseudarthrobacter TaxID=2647000 RepID=UPI002E81D3A4|nr:MULTISPECIES: iron chelate uptake ABC transporter family permease subunit [unclassified Pseudarthrobacter]MEE2522612.1 iron chelate uptake ABC transporter family permease subunit [Pseudarthrobacter sp. J47]MEE2530715.1 iron chelate uptake ABC transporter family permease subunit [Pseudarthrobacter sp. J75]MEE2571031.1 iron chelate uptake ABC transporter family permease subunit [Pseudarthrobacter sp. J64]
MAPTPSVPPPDGAATKQTAVEPLPASTGVKPGAVRRGKWRLLLLLVALVALAGAALLSLAVGAKSIPMSSVIEAFVSYADTVDHAIVLENRLPRTLLGIGAGMALGSAGALIQAITRNPLADPGVLGVNAGATFAIVVAVGVFGVSSISGYVWFALAGAVLAAAAVYLIGSSGRNIVNPVRITLAGVALGAVLTGVSSGMTLLKPEAFDQLRSWSIGSLDSRSMDNIAVAAPFILLGLLIAAFCTRGLNAVSLGDELATSLGVNANRARILGLIAITLLSGAATAAAGPIGFIGLMIPHVARWLIGPDQRWIMAFTMVLSPLLLLLSDVLGRVAVPGELQVGIVTSFIGAPVLVALARRRKASGL